VWGDNLRWKNKVAGGFTNSGSMSGDKLNTLIDLALFAAQHGMIWVGLAEYSGWNTSSGSPEDLNRPGSWLGVMSQSNNDESPEVTPGVSDLRTAEALGRRIAETTHVFRAGRDATEFSTASS
jgi:NAD(P)H dehydrogenase (quinone)